jgi:hypothetical protein
MRTLFTRLALALVLLASLTASECWFYGYPDLGYAPPEPGTGEFTSRYGSDIGRYAYDLGYYHGFWAARYG